MSPSSTLRSPLSDDPTLSLLQFVTVLPYDSKTKQFRLIREYWQGPHSIGLGVACGSFEENKHASTREAAECELSEECCLKGGKWVRLIPESHPGLNLCPKP